MATIMPRARVAPPPRNRAQAGSLLSSADRPADGLRWGGGVAFEAEICDWGNSWDPCQDWSQSADPNTSKDIPDREANGEWDPYGIYIGDKCSALAGTLVYDETSARTTAALERQTSHLIERILWTNIVQGDDFALGGHPNVALSDAAADTLTTGPVGIVNSVYLAIEAINEALGGERGMIHVPAPVAAYLNFYGLIVRQGQTLQVAGTDHLVVAGSGYTGSGPGNVAADAGTVWMYVTSPVAVRTSDILVTPPNVAAAVDRDTNLIEVRAERLAVAYWDLCLHGAIEVCLPDPGPACETGS
jgi:hypothetical protein